MIKLICTIVILVFAVETVSAQSSFSSQSENEDQIFGTYRVLGNSGVIGYGLSHESGIDRNSVISEFIDEFGLYDEALNEHNIFKKDFVKGI